MQYNVVMTHRGQASASDADLPVAQEPQEGSEPMTTVLLPETDPRGPKAVAIATDSGQWLKCRTTDGRKAYGIRSSRDANTIYFTTRTSCTCYDARRHDCKHILAVRLHCELVEEQQAVAKYDDIFARFEQDDRPLPTADLSRILGKPRRGVIPAALIERED
jgi:hypothetical protein